MQAGTRYEGLTLADYSALADQLLEETNVKAFRVCLDRQGLFKLSYAAGVWEVLCGESVVTTDKLRAAMPEMVAAAWRSFSAAASVCLQCGKETPDKLCSKECKRAYYTAQNAAKAKA